MFYFSYNRIVVIKVANLSRRFLDMKQKYSKWVVGAASAALVASAIVPVASAASFSDIESSDHKDAILALADANIVGGYTDGTFKPNAVVTRGNVTKFLGKWLVSEGYEIPADYKTVARFTDLPTSAPDQELLQYAALVKDAGVFKGSNNKLMHTNNMSREQMAVVLVRAINTVYGVDLVADYKESEFKSAITDLDKATATENREAIIALEYAGLTNVKAFNPKNSLTRGQFASFLNRTITNVAGLTVKEAKAVDATTLEVTLSDDTKHTVKLETPLEENKATKVEFEIEGKTYSAEVTYEVTKFKVETANATNGTITVKLAEKAEAVEAKNFTVTQAINGGEATVVKASSAVLAADGLTVTLTVDKVAAQETTEQSVVYTVNEVAAPAFVVDASIFKVTSVTAINGKTVEVKFSQAVKKSTVVNSGKLVNVSFTSLETPAKTITSASADAELSEDGKTLTITAQTSEVFEGRYQVKAENVETTKSEKLPKYDEIINLGKDTVAPSIVSATKVNATTTKVTFSEAVTVAANSITYKLADGTVVPASDVTVNSLTGKEITFTVATGKYVGKTINATIVGAVDAAGNLLAPNPSTFSMQVGDKDGVAPTVTSVKSLAANKLEVVFSEEVQGFATTDASTAAANFTLTGGTVAPVTATKIEQDTTDKKKYVVTLNGSAITSPATSALGDAKVIKTNITDLSGEPMAADYNSIVTVTADTTAPTLVSSSVVTEAGIKYLELVFSESMDASAPIAISGTATSYKDFVTTTGALTLGTLSQGASDKVVRVALADTKFAGVALDAGTKYDFKVTAKDANAVETTSPIAVSFTNEAVASTNKPVIENVTANVIAPGNVTNNTIDLVFDRELDGASATNAANYTIAGVTVKSATLAAVSGGKQTVTLTLDTNELTGNRAITVANVKSKAGIVMDTFSGLVNLTENVKPEVKSAKVTGTKTIEVTFSEVIDGFADADDFVIKAGATTLAYGTTANTLSTDGTKLTITLDSALTAAQLAETITLETLVGGTSPIVDKAATPNQVKTGIVTVAK